MAHDMEEVKISPKFQVVIPKAVRESLRLTADQRLRIVLYGDRIELVPVREIGEMRGVPRRHGHPFRAGVGP